MWVDYFLTVWSSRVHLTKKITVNDDIVDRFSGFDFVGTMTVIDCLYFFIQTKDNLQKIIVNCGK